MKLNVKFIAKSILAVSSLTVVLASCGTPTYPSSAVDSNAEFEKYSSFSVNPVTTTATSVSKLNSAAFVRGFDISALHDIERGGGIFYDENNKRSDMLKILKDNGVNTVRIRVWNDPYNANSTPSMENFGYNTLEKAKSMSVRAKKLGLKTLIDFHYSDTWAHPGQQLYPSAWDNVSSIAELASVVGDYTKKSVQYLADAGATPDYVQIGNEIDSGLLLQTSKNGTPSVKAGNNGMNDATAKVLNAAGAAVKSVDSSIEVMIHVANPSYYTKVTSRSDLDSSIYDAIGVSFYPCNASRKIADLKTAISKIVAAGKKAYVAETSFPWTCEWVEGKSDNETNTIYYTGTDSLATAYTNLNVEKHLVNFGITTDSYNGTSIISPSYKNQAAVLSEVMLAVAEAGGDGVYYWGGEWVATSSVPSSWENQALFDYDGKVLPSIKAFNLKATEGTSVFDKVPEPKIKNLCDKQNFTADTSTYVKILDNSKFENYNITELKVVVTLSDNGGSDEWWASVSAANSWNSATYKRTTWSDSDNGYSVTITETGFLSNLATNGLYIEIPAVGSTGTVTVDMSYYE